MSILYKNYVDEYFNGDLLLHIQKGENDKVQTVLKEAAPYHHVTDNAGATLLHFAAKYGNAEMAQRLIELGANVDAENRINETPLMYAYEADREATVRLLLEANADIYKRDFRGDSVLGKCLREREETVEYVQPTVRKMRERGVDGNAVKKIRENITTAVVSKVSSESLRSSEYIAGDAFHRDCPLYRFIPLGDAEVTRVLLQKGSPVDAKNPSGQTALHEAVNRLDLENVKLLLEYDADVNAYDVSGKTPLAYIQNFEDESKTLEVAKALTAVGAQLIDNRRGIIHAALLLQHGNVEMLETLLQCSICMQFDDEHGRTPLDYLVMNKNPCILKKLRDTRPMFFEQSKEQMLRIAARECRIDVMKYLLNFGTKMNAKDRENRTALGSVVEVVSKLRSTTPVDENVYDEYLKCVEYLLECGADPQTISKENTTYDRYSRIFPLLSNEIIRVIEPIFAHLSLLEVSGQVINQSLQNEIKSNYQLAKIFLFNKHHLKEMKEIGIDESITLFEFSIANGKQMSLYTRDPSFISNLTNVMKKRNFDSYFGRRLYRRFLRFSQLMKWKGQFLPFISEVLIELCNLSIDNVAEKIVDYMLHEKWEEMLL